MITALAQQPVALNLILFVVAAIGVWCAGVRLAHYADAIADRKKIGHAFMGLVFVAAVTSLPEMVTTLYGAFAGQAELVLGNMFGGITMQTAILAVADLSFAGMALTAYPRGPASALEATLLIGLLALLLGLHAVGEFMLPIGVGLGTLLLGVAYVAIVMVLREYDKSETWLPVGACEPVEPQITEMPPEKALDKVSFPGLVRCFILLGLAILICALGLTVSAAAIAEQSGISSSFIGVTLLAAATSLPEVSTTIAAVRIGAYSMAISNIFGSNLLMVALILPADLVYIGNPILGAIDQATAFALVSGVLVTSIYLAGLLIRSPKTIFGIGRDSALVLVVYAVTLAVYYHFS